MQPIKKKKKISYRKITDIRQEKIKLYSLAGKSFVEIVILFLCLF